jgi:hypothetical protein
MPYGESEYGVAVYEAERYFQPHLPAENISEAEIIFMDDEPPGLFPQNQDSNFGFVVRKIFSDKIQNLIDQKQILYSEKFVDTSSIYLDEHEREVGLPPAPVGYTINQRRLFIKTRLARGPFTRSRRNAIIESYIFATFGTPFDLRPTGHPLSIGGEALHGLPADVSTIYRVVEDTLHFSYTVRISNAHSVDDAGLTRDLYQITPAGISFTIIYVAVP